uniref:V-type proton ATPase subunit n=1 Tax=Arcella intermedia TaxID=1963864 RepID=A0A6B2L8Y4_9EUKA
MEGIVRGYYLGLLKRADYGNLTQCDVLDDLKLQLQGTSYGTDFLSNEPSPLYTTTIQDQATQVLIKQFNFIKQNSVQPLTKFLDYITYGYMIDNVVLLITGAMHERNVKELVSKCHPLGYFDAMEVVAVEYSDVKELYDSVLVDTPLAPYLQGCLDGPEADLGEKEMEVVRNTLYKAYLEDFDRFCTEQLGGITGEIMHNLLQFEADRRSINITINSFGTDLQKEDRQNLYPNLGLLAPEGTERLAKADELDDVVKIVMEYGKDYSKYITTITSNEDKSLEDAFFEHEVRLHQASFEQQFHYALFYSYFKLKEQEIRNILWIAECILQDHKAEINQYIPLDIDL